MVAAIGAGFLDILGLTEVPKKSQRLLPDCVHIHAVLCIRFVKTRIIKEINHTRHACSKN